MAPATNRTITKQEITRIPIPKTEDIEKHREDKLLEQMIVRLKSGIVRKSYKLLPGSKKRDTIQFKLRQQL